MKNFERGISPTDALDIGIFRNRVFAELDEART